MRGMPLKPIAANVNWGTSLTRGAGDSARAVVETTSNKPIAQQNFPCMMHLSVVTRWKSRKAAHRNRLTES
jgi:hypothetical protein